MRNVSTIGILCSVMMMLGGCASDVGSGTEALRQACGGFAGFACPDGQICVDDPSDSCDPESGGADCIGVCRNEPGGRQCDHGRGVTYVSRSTAECAAIRFLCAEGSEPFFNECGCGCRPIPGESCGPTTCGEGEVCCNESCGICTAPGGFCTEQFCSYL